MKPISSLPFLNHLLLCPLLKSFDKVIMVCEPMPCTFRIDKSLQTVFTTVKGSIALQDVRDLVRNLIENPDFNPSFNQLTDFREVTELKVTSAELKAIISETPDYISEEACRAVILPSQPAVWGILKMYKILLGLEPRNIQKNFQTFEDMETAQNWLGLSSD